MRRTILVITFLTFFCGISFAQLSRELQNFRELDVTDKINVKVIPSSKNEIIIEGELANQLELSQNNDVLRLKMVAGYIMKGDKVNVTLYTSSAVSSIIARKGAQIKNESKELQLDSIYLSANEGAVVDLKLHTNKVQAWTTTGGTIKLQGEATTQDVNIALGGSYLAKDLLSDSAVIRTSAGGKGEVNVGKSVDAQTRAGGVLDIYGNPKDRKQRRLAGGKINYL